MYYLHGKVIKGDGYGRKIGFPTANLGEVKGEKPEDGVYAGSANIQGKEYKAGIVIGPRGKVEAHLIDFNGDLYGIEIALTINKFLREYKNFNTEEELKEQIKKDIELC